MKDDAQAQVASRTSPVDEIDSRICDLGIPKPWRNSSSEPVIEDLSAHCRQFWKSGSIRHGWHVKVLSFGSKQKQTA